VGDIFADRYGGGTEQVSPLRPWSGTTLVQTTLDSHPRLTVLDEALTKQNGGRRESAAH